MSVTPSRIEIASPPSEPNNVKGNLLEQLAEDLLRSQSFTVERQVRKTACELDLVCRHVVDGRRIYNECKGQREVLSSTVLRQLLGTVTFDNYDEGWLISASQLGKDAKGFKEEWERKDGSTRRRLSIYTPERLIASLQDANVLSSPPQHEARQLVERGQQLGEWILLVTTVGRYWAVPVVPSGVPREAIVYDAREGRRIHDPDLLREIRRTDSSIAQLTLSTGSPRLLSEDGGPTDDRIPKVVQVAQGESWADYRPARPEHFVGRREAQDRILDFLDSVRVGATATRIFAITGDTGMGKSSLVGKLRSRLSNVRHRGRFFMLAVDMRAAQRAEYITASLLTCLRSASAKGYGSADPAELVISDPADPLASESVQAYLSTVAQRESLLCIVLDQFEELYSKSELFPVFEEARRLALSVAASGSPVALGFVLRADSTVQQDHPAYHLWHKLADHRYEIRLNAFTQTEAKSALRLFEHELGQQLRPDLGRQILENSEGYPWLLKKLCIHLYEQIKAGTNQSELDETMDVDSLFARDLNSCSPAERACLQEIARQSPADWYEILESAGAEVVRALQDRRLIVRSGDRINLYWDVFREYVLTGRVPTLPFTYLPWSPSLGALLSVAARLDQSVAASCEQLSSASGLSVKTVRNVVHDLVMFGVAVGSPTAVLADARLGDTGEQTTLERIRAVMRRHAVYRVLERDFETRAIAVDDLIRALRQVNPTAQHRPETWRAYAERLAMWLIASGLLSIEGSAWIVRDSGFVQVPSRRGSRFRVGIFLGDAPPRQVVNALVWLQGKGSATRQEIKEAGFRNAVRLLERLDLATTEDSGSVASVCAILEREEAITAVWRAAKGDETLRLVADYLLQYPSSSGEAIGEWVASHEGQTWSDASKVRTGNALANWAIWVNRHDSKGRPMPPPGSQSMMEIPAGESLPFSRRGS